MSSASKLTSLIILMGMGLTFYSCGKKNVVNSTPSTAYNNPQLTASPTFLNSYSTIRNKVSCLNGRYRLNTDVTFSMTGGSNSQSTIYGQFQSGPVQGGSVSEMYVGVSAYRDLMFVTKITNNGSLVGYNVTISYCSVPNSYSTYPDLVSNDRSITNFQTPYGITINSSNNCGYGLVAAAYYTYALSNRIPSNSYTSDFPVYTTFSNTGCF